MGWSRVMVHLVVEDVVSWTNSREKSMNRMTMEVESFYFPYPTLYFLCFAAKRRLCNVCK